MFLTSGKHGGDSKVPADSQAGVSSRERKSCRRTFLFVSVVVSSRACSAFFRSDRLCAFYIAA